MKWLKQREEKQSYKISLFLFSKINSNNINNTTGLLQSQTSNQLNLLQTKAQALTSKLNLSLYSRPDQVLL